MYVGPRAGSVIKFNASQSFRANNFGEVQKMLLEIAKVSDFDLARHFAQRMLEKIIA